MLKKRAGPCSNSSLRLLLLTIISMVTVLVCNACYSAERGVREITFDAEILPRYCWSETRDYCAVPTPDDHMIYIVDIAGAGITDRLDTREAAYPLAYEADCRLIATATDKSISIWRKARSWKRIAKYRFPPDSGPVFAAFDNETNALKIVLLGGFSTCVIRWDYDTHAEPPVEPRGAPCKDPTFADLLSPAEILYHQPFPCAGPGLEKGAERIWLTAKGKVVCIDLCTGQVTSSLPAKRPKLLFLSDDNRYLGIVDGLLIAPFNELEKDTFSIWDLHTSTVVYSGREGNHLLALDPDAPRAFIYADLDQTLTEYNYVHDSRRVLTSWKDFDVLAYGNSRLLFLHTNRLKIRILPLPWVRKD